ncbi:Bacteriophage Rz lysis protein [compost metagenome]
MGIRAKLIFGGIVVLVLLAMAAGAAWWIQGQRYERRLADLRLVHERERGQISQAVAAELAKREKHRQELQLQLDGIDQQRYGELRHAQSVIDQLAGRLATAEQRMRVPVVGSSCPAAGVPAGPGSAGLDDGAQYADIQPATAAALTRLAADADACAVKLMALQDRERARLSMTSGSRVPPPESSELEPSGGAAGT